MCAGHVMALFHRISWGGGGCPDHGAIADNVRQVPTITLYICSCKSKD